MAFFFDGAASYLSLSLAPTGTRKAYVFVRRILLILFWQGLTKVDDRGVAQ